MSTALIREIVKLERVVNSKYASLMQRVTQLELNQAASSQVTDIVALIGSLTVGLSYTPNPQTFAPLYVMPPVST